MIETDYQRVLQIVINLVSNAIKFTPKGKIVFLSRLINTELKSYLQISILDNGVGIAEEDKDKIFRQYEKLGNHENKSGTGLGLFISKLIAESFGGGIEFESFETLGTVFRFHFELVKIVDGGESKNIKLELVEFLENIQVPRRRTTNLSIASDGMRVLIVDD